MDFGILLNRGCSRLSPENFWGIVGLQIMRSKNSTHLKQCDKSV